MFGLVMHNIHVSHHFLYTCVSPYLAQESLEIM